MKYAVNNVKRKIRANKKVFGTWLNLPSLEVTEIVSRSDFDFITIDMEHTAIDVRTMQSMIALIEANGKVPYVRVEENTQVPVKKALDAGAYGVIVPMVNCAGDAKTAIHNTYYVPKGKRGVGLSRAQGYGMSFDEYLKWYKKNISLVVQIEHIHAINNLEEILSFSEIDATIIGPYDLSASLGFPGAFNNKEVRNALRRYEEVSKKFKKPFGYHVVHPDKTLLSKKEKDGYSFIVYGIDEIFLSESVAAAVASCKRK